MEYIYLCVYHSWLFYHVSPLLVNNSIFNSMQYSVHFSGLLCLYTSSICDEVIITLM
jgi:hypothetical protein